MDDFSWKVIEAVMRIPVGRVSTYGAIARHVGAGRSARLVGHVLNTVGAEMDVPCHRVVNRNGELTGRMHFATPSLMRELLEAEGVAFVGDAVDLPLHFWDPES